MSLPLSRLPPPTPYPSLSPSLPGTKFLNKREVGPQNRNHGPACINQAGGGGVGRGSGKRGRVSLAPPDGRGVKVLFSHPRSLQRSEVEQAWAARTGMGIFQLLRLPTTYPNLFDFSVSASLYLCLSSSPVLSVRLLPRS